MALTRASAAVIKTEELVNNRNLIINGGIDVWQRPTSGSRVNGDYINDMFIIEPRNPTTVNYARSTDVPSTEGFNYSMRIFATNETDNGFHWRIPIELPATGIYNNFGPGKTYTLSYWAKSAYTGRTINPIALLTNNAKGGVLSEGQSLGQITLTTSWVRYTHTITFSTWVADGASNLANATSLIFRFLSGVNNTPQDTYITGIQFEEASVATPFERRPFGTELALCQRYLPAVSAVSGTVGPLPGIATALTTNAQFIFIHPVPTRIPGTGVVVSASTHFNFSNNDGNSSSTAVSFAAGGTNASQITITVASSRGATTTPGWIYTNNASAILYITGCEL